MNKSFVIKGTIYPFDIHAFVGDDLNKCHDFIRSFVPEEFAENVVERFDGNYKGYTLQGINGDVIIYYTAKPELGLLCHEAFHCVEFIFDHVGIKHTKSTSEAYAYFLNYIVNELTKGIDDEILRSSDSVS